MIEMPMIPEPIVSDAVLKRLGLTRRAWTAMSLEEKVDILQGRVMRDAEKGEMRADAPLEPQRRPQDTEEPVIWFVKTFGNPAKEYVYVAHKEGPDRWFMTTNNLRDLPVSWAQLFEFVILREPEVPTIYRAVKWEIVT